MNTILAIDISNSKTVCAIAKNDIAGKINILGVGIEKSKGIEKGSITNIDLASSSIKKSIESAKSYTITEIDSVYATISGAFTKEIKSSGTANVPSGQITKKEINLVIQTALTNANIPTDYDTIHSIPLSFKVDDNENIEDPLNMIGGRLEVKINSIIAKKSYLNNIRQAVKSSGHDVDFFVLNSYATAHALVDELDEEKKQNGYLVIDIGSTSTNASIIKGKSIVSTFFIPVGSENITKDLSIMLNTPSNIAEAVKIKHGTLINSGESDERIKFPKGNDDSAMVETSIEYIISIVHARLEELLIILRDKIEQKNELGIFKSGIILTGGACNIRGIRDLCFKVFNDKMVKIDCPANIRNDFLNFEEPIYATSVGLIQFALDKSKSYELDSSKKLRAKEPKQATQAPRQTQTFQPTQAVEAKPAVANDFNEVKIKKTKNTGFMAKLKELIEGHL